MEVLFNEKSDAEFVIVKGEGDCEDLFFPSKPSKMSKTSMTAIKRINEVWSKPGVNVACLLKVTHEGTEVSKLLYKTPTNAIWVNAGKVPLLIKIKRNNLIRSMLLNLGFAIVS